MTSPEQGIISRIREIMAYFNYNQSSMAKATGLKQPNLSAILNSKRPCDDAVINKICISLDINKNWLLFGEGDMLKNTEESNARFLGHVNNLEPLGLVPVRFFEITPTATFKEFCSTCSEEASTTYIPAFENLDDSYCVFEVNGESMIPQIQNKAHVLCKEVPPSKWHTLTKGVITIAYADKFVIKRILHNALDTENFILLGSDNTEEYPETFKVQLSDIRTIFQAKRIIDQPIS